MSLADLTAWQLEHVLSRDIELTQGIKIALVLSRITFGVWNQIRVDSD